MKYQFEAEDMLLKLRKILHSEVVFGGDVDARDGETWKIQVDTNVLPSVHYLWILVASKRNGVGN